MKIKTYYTYCPNHSGRKETALMELWHTVWLNLGWETETMGHLDARLHPYFEQFDSIVGHFPTVNSKEYEAACFHRWLALAQTGGGFMSDYDVFPSRNFNPEMMDESKLDPAKLHVFQNLQVCPSLVWCAPEVAVKVCEHFASSEYGFRPQDDRPHYSDMYALFDMFHAGLDWIQTHDLVRDYHGSPEWDKAALIHFNNCSMQQDGKIPKFEYIPKILASL